MTDSYGYKAINGRYALGADARGGCFVYQVEQMQPVGHWTFRNITVAQHRRPSWLRRLIASWLLEAEWKDYRD